MAASTESTALARFDGDPGQARALETTLSMPYTLSTGPSVGAFLAELANHRIVGSRVGPGHPVLVPAQDFSPETGEEAGELVVVSPRGVVTAFTQTAEHAFAFIRLDGADTDLLHRVVDATPEQLELGLRVTARWAAAPEGTMLDLAGFAPDAEGAPSEPFVAELLSTTTEPIPEQPYALELEYHHAYGPYYGRLFDEIGHARRIVGTRSPSGAVLVPPRALDDATYARTEQWADVADTGIIQAFSIIHLEFVGQTREPPYVYIEVQLDGMDTRLIHSLGEIDVELAREKLVPGMRVRAVWRDRSEATGTLNDIEHFELIEPLS
jgi:uncharacterized OB-fold protein